ncbi:hypothetical protein N1851_009452 [Merluccius polli]|uniref:Uncharacterized protein n=1 Tax=Merluccius polli TaxID=89951 RepID=A0AA47P3W0_MERPO|nr:hypothetical protein N1851_009452 [Merluccius polli]
MDQRFLLRVIIAEDDIRKLTLNNGPQSIEEFKVQLVDKLSLQYDFKLQYEDQDFNNAVCNHHHPPQHQTLSAAQQTLRSCELQQWPEFFDIPNFSVDVGYRLRQADLAFMKDGTRMTLPRDMKHDILEKLAETMYSFKAYPQGLKFSVAMTEIRQLGSPVVPPERQNDDFSSVAKALISKHPCLTEPGPHRWYGWKNSLKFKMANYRTKLRKDGCENVAINGGKRSKGNLAGESSSKNIKRPKRGEANYLPNLPKGHDETSLENARMVPVEEMKKNNQMALSFHK